MIAEPTSEEITNALQLDTMISESDAWAIRDVMKSINVNLEVISDALRPLVHQATLTVKEVGKLHKLLFPNTDGEPRAMNTNKQYPTSTPPWARIRK